MLFKLKINKRAIHLITDSQTKQYAKDHEYMDHTYQGSIVDYLVLTDQQDSLDKILFGNIESLSQGEPLIVHYVLANSHTFSITMDGKQNFSQLASGINGCEVRYLVGDKKGLYESHLNETDRCIQYFYNPYKLFYKNGYLLKTYIKSKSLSILFNKETLKFSHYCNNKISFKYVSLHLWNHKFKIPVRKYLSTLTTKLGAFLFRIINHTSLDYRQVSTSNLNKAVNNPFWSDVVVDEALLQSFYRLDYLSSSNRKVLKKAMYIYRTTGNVKKSRAVLYQTTSKQLQKQLSHNYSAYYNHLQLVDHFGKAYTEIPAHVVINFIEDATIFSSVFVTSPAMLEFLKEIKTDLVYLLCASYRTRLLFRDSVYILARYPQLVEIVQLGKYTKKDIHLIHDLLTQASNRLKNKNKSIPITKEENSLSYTSSGFQLRPVSETNELSDVGTWMDICVGSYASSAVKKDCTIFVVYQFGVPVCCIERRDSAFLDGVIVQVKTARNRKVPVGSELHAFLSDWATTNTLKVSTTDFEPSRYVSHEFTANTNTAIEVA